MKLKQIALTGAAAVMLAVPVATTLNAAPAKKAPAKKAAGKAAKSNLVPLSLKLPKPAFVGTPKNIPAGTTVEKPTGKPRPTFFVPRGTTNVAAGKSVTSSDDYPIIGTLDLITNGDKEASEGSWVELGPGTQWVQIDLGRAYNIYGVVLWHYHGEARVYRDVVVQIADDQAFTKNVRTVFNNDQDNTSGRGKGTHREYFELAEGKLINAKGIKGRFVRLYSRGNTSDDQNQYTEVEVYGK